MSRIILLGVDHRGIADESQALLASCQAVFAAERFRPLLHEIQCPIHPISPLSEALTKVEQLLKKNCNVGMLASGDPLFFGIGQTLINRFGKDSIEIHPALSSLQLAFSRIKKCWQEAHVVSLHGRNTLPKTVLQHDTVFLFTDKTNTPARIAQQFCKFIADTAGCLQEEKFQVYVLENLGLPDENICTGSLAQIAAKTFDDLNVMIVLAADLPPEKKPYRLGLTEEDVQHSRGLITKDEIRAVILHKLKLPKEGVFWDIGAGSGSISIEAARVNPVLDIFSIEKNTDEQGNISANSEQYFLTNIHLVKGQAPEALTDLPHPDRVFIGGSGGNLGVIISHLAAVLAAKGRIVVSAVTDATRAAAPQLLHENGFQVDISDVQITRRAYPEDKQNRTKLNPITIITGISNDR